MSNDITCTLHASGHHSYKFMGTLLVGLRYLWPWILILPATNQLVPAVLLTDTTPQNVALSQKNKVMRGPVYKITLGSIKKDFSVCLAIRFTRVHHKVV